MGWGSVLGGGGGIFALPCSAFRVRFGRRNLGLCALEIEVGCWVGCSRVWVNFTVFDDHGGR